jgi:hypothetical protein
MSNYTIPIDLAHLTSIVEMCRYYFDSKYPCTTDDNCGDDMTLEDSYKQAIYNFLLMNYNKSNPLAIRLHEEVMNKLKIKSKD